MFCFSLVGKTKSRISQITLMSPMTFQTETPLISWQIVEKNPSHCVHNYRPPRPDWFSLSLCKANPCYSVLPLDLDETFMCYTKCAESCFLLSDFSSIDAQSWLAAVFMNVCRHAALTCASHAAPSWINVNEIDPKRFALLSLALGICELGNRLGDSESV